MEGAIGSSQRVAFYRKMGILGILAIEQDPDWFQMDSRLVVMSKGRAQITSGALGQCFCIEITTT